MAATSGISHRFHGAWRLVSPTSDGMIYYDPSGQMSVQTAPRKARPRAGASATPEEARTAIEGYIAYFGTWTIDETAGTVTHHQVASVQPGPAGALVRSYEFTVSSQGGNRLILRPVDRPGEIVWERIA